MKQRVLLTFSSELATEPVIYNLGMQFRLVTNIIRAELREDWGWAILELEGEDKDIEEAIAWATSKGVKVDSVVGNNAKG